MIQFERIEIPITLSMIDLAEQADHPFQKYFCFWVAFNNLYTLISQKTGNTVRLNLNNSQQVKFEQKWNYTFPKVVMLGERSQISKAISQLDPQIKDDLILHRNTQFFVERVPKGVLSDHDELGQPINGVLNVTLTVNQQYPIWSPIDIEAYERYIAGDRSNIDSLTEQIIFLLYTVRNNLVHGSKSPGEENDIRVVDNALPLLELVVRAFLRLDEVLS